jgi:ion channel-forming bestrophin family protein
MIVREYPNVFGLFLVVQGSVVPRIYGHILFLIVFSILILVLDAHLMPLPHISMQPFAVIGVALSLFLGFRNNAAYERWWQARMLWGQLTASVRALGHETRIYLDARSREDILCLAGAFMHLHRARLRNSSEDAEDALAYVDRETLERFELSTNPASAALQEIDRKLAELAHSGQLSGFGQRSFTDRLGEMELSRTSNEGIHNTPMPFVYNLLVWQTSFLYCLLLPFGLIEETGWMAPIFSGIAAYVFFGLAAVTDELEHPFRATANGLPLDALCRSVDIGLAEQMGRTPPPPLQVRRYILT